MGRSLWSQRYSFIAVLALALAAVVVLTYAPATKNAFHFDDLLNIRENPTVRIDSLTSENLIRAATDRQPTRRPLAYVTFALDWWRGGGSPAAFQQTNIAIHAATSIAVFALFIQLFTYRGQTDRRAVAASAIAAGLWAVHPIQVQAVTYIVQRMASLGGFFMVTSVVFFISARRATKAPARLAYGALCLSAMIAGSATKETAWVTPALLLIAELGVIRAGGPLIRNAREKWVAVISATVLGISGVTLLGATDFLQNQVLAGYARRAFTLGERLLTQPRVILFHLSQIVWPQPNRFSLEHDFVVSTSLTSPPTTIIAIIAIIAWCLIATTWLFKGRSRVLGFLGLWVPITLVVESTIVPLEMVFEHRMYVPTIGIFGLVALLFNRLMKHQRWTAIVAVAIGLVTTILLAISTRTCIAAWRTPISLAERSVQAAPVSVRPRINLGVAYLDVGDWRRAEPLLIRAVELEPEDPKALAGLGVLFFDQQRYTEAKELLQRALANESPNPSTYNSLGEVYLALDDPARAERWFRMSLSGRPWGAAQHWNLALALERQDRCEEAREEWVRYLEVSNDEEDKAAVHEHLLEQHDSPGGGCFKTK